MSTRALKPLPTSGKYFPEIDGIKFFTTLAVVWSHGEAYFWGMTAGQFAAQKQRWALLFNIINNAGVRGMELFFVLSGFLLSLPFARHYLQGAPPVSTRYYYLRRLTRIEPPYVIAMVMALLLCLGLHTLPVLLALKSFAASLFYCHLLVFHELPYLNGVAWSLEVEVQFYLIAPLLFQLFRLPALWRRCILCGGIALLVALVQWLLPPKVISIYTYSYYFLAGMLLTEIVVAAKDRHFSRPKWMILPAIICAALILCLPAQRLLAARLALPFVIVCFCFCVLRVEAVRRIFRYKWIPVIGGMSYSIYLLHNLTILRLDWLFIRLLGGLPFEVQWACQMLIVLALTMAIALPFYFFIERPFMRWRPGVLKGRAARDK